MDEDPLFEKPIDDLVPQTARSRSAKRDGGSRSSFGRDTPPDELFAIGRGQRALIRWVLIGLLCRFVGLLVAALVPSFEPTLLAAIVLPVALAIDIATAVVFVRFASYLYPTAVVVVLVLCVLSCLGLLVVALVNARATGVLTRNGVRVGLLGARRADLDQLAPADHDKRSGGNLPKLGW